MKKVLLFVVFIFGICIPIFSQLLPQNKLIVDKSWWARMTSQYPGFHATQNRWMSSGDFNKDGLPDVVLQFAAVGKANMFWQDSNIDSKRFKAVFINRGLNTFELDTNQVFSFKGGDDGHIVLDMNGDGFLDVFQPTDNWHGSLASMPSYYNSSANMGEFMFINKANKSFEGSFFNNTGGSTKQYQVIDIDKDKDDELAFIGMNDEIARDFPMRYPYEDSIQVFDYSNKLQRKTLQLFQRNPSDTLFKNRLFVPMFSKLDTLYGILKDPRNEIGSSSLDMFGYITAKEKKAISKLFIPNGLSRKPFHNTGRQGFAQDLDGDGKFEYLFSFWKQSDETTYAVLFNEDGRDVSNQFFPDSLNYKIGKIMTGISDVFDDINHDGYVDILPNHGLGFKFKNQFSYFLYNPTSKKFEVKKLHSHPISFLSEQAKTDSLGFWPHYDYQSHTAILQYFDKRKDQDALFTNIISYKMDCDFVVRPQISTSSIGICLQNDSLSIKLKSINPDSRYSLTFNNKTTTYDSQINRRYVKELGPVYITESTIDGCVLRSDTVKITQKNIPNQPSISSTSALTFCAGGNVVLKSNANTNQWYLNGTLIPNASSSTFTASSTGQYQVKAMLDGCTSPLSLAANVIVNPIPVVPTITQESNGRLTSSSMDWNQWYFNDVKIEGATQKSYTPIQSGNYSVKVISPCGTESSKSVNIVITSMEESVMSQIQGSPNPVESFFTIRFPKEFGRSAQVRLFDLAGALRLAKSTVIDGEVLDLGSLSSGNYLLQINSNDHAASKLIKISKGN